MPEAGPSKPRLRANKACENCRLRKTRCSGVTPCEPCKSAGIDGQCFVRNKARPNRPAPAIIARTRVRAFSPPAPPAPSHSINSDPQLRPSSLSTPRVNPLEYLRSFVQQWGTENGLNAELLLFHDSPRLARLIATPLPPYPARRDFEDGLIDSLISTDVPYLQCLDKSRLTDLYSMYRASPESVTGDQAALIYASLCFARYNQLRRAAMNEGRVPAERSREDITYYHLARESLASWEGLSITGMWALSSLAMYAQLNGSPGEYGEITSLWAWQIKGLGLHKRDIIQAHPERDLGEALIASYCYGETLRAIMIDLDPAILIAQIDMDLDRIPNGISHSMARASNHAVRFLRDYANPDSDITSNAYIAASEGQLSDDMTFLRAQRMRGIDRIKQGWAEMRLHWLRILLYIPHLTEANSQSGPALMILARSLVNIINIHTEAAQAGRLDPSWPQLVRIMTCGQLLVLCCARGELHTLETTAIFSRLVALLGAHITFWPSVQDAITGFRLAALRFDIAIPGIQLKAGESQSTGLVDGTDWSSPFVDPDMELDADLPGQGTLW